MARRAHSSCSGKCFWRNTSISYTSYSCSPYHSTPTNKTRSCLSRPTEESLRGAAALALRRGHLFLKFSVMAMVIAPHSVFDSSLSPTTRNLLIERPCARQSQTRYNSAPAPASVKLTLENDTTQITRGKHTPALTIILSVSSVSLLCGSISFSKRVLRSSDIVLFATFFFFLLFLLERMKKRHALLIRAQPASLLFVFILVVIV